MMIFESLYFWITFVILLSLVSVYWVVPKIENLEGVAINRLNSMASGITISFLFLYTLPNLYVAFEITMKNIGALHFGIKNYVGHFISLAFLFGFSLHYMLEKFLQRKIQKTDWDALNNQEKKSGYDLVSFYCSMIIWMVFHFSIMFIIPVVVTSSLVFTGFFMALIGLHFFLNQHDESRYFRGKYQYYSKGIMSISLLSGCVAGLTMIHHPKPFMIILIGSFIAGVLLMNAIKREFYGNKKPSDSIVFLSSLILSSLVILLIFIVENKRVW